MKILIKSLVGGLNSAGTLFLGQCVWNAFKKLFDEAPVTQALSQSTDINKMKINFHENRLPSGWMTPFNGSPFFFPQSYYLET